MSLSTNGTGRDSRSHAGGGVSMPLENVQGRESSCLAVNFTHISTAVLAPASTDARTGMPRGRFGDGHCASPRLPVFEGRRTALFSPGPPSSDWRSLWPSSRQSFPSKSSADPPHHGP